MINKLIKIVPVNDFSKKGEMLTRYFIGGTLLNMYQLTDEQKQDPEIMKVKEILDNLLIKGSV